MREIEERLEFVVTFSETSQPITTISTTDIFPQIARECNLIKRNGWTTAASSERVYKKSNNDTYTRQYKLEMELMNGAI